MTENIIKTACEFVKSNPVSHLATVDNDKPDIRVMYCPRIDEDLTVWFSTSAASNKARQIMSNPEIAVEFYADGKMLKILGSAEVLNDQATKDELWEEDWTRYWPNGREDPDYCVIKITPVAAAWQDMNADPMKTINLI